MWLPFHVQPAPDLEPELDEEEPTLKLNLAIEQLKAAHARRQEIYVRCLSEHPPTLPAPGEQ